MNPEFFEELLKNKVDVSMRTNLDGTVVTVTAINKMTGEKVKVTTDGSTEVDIVSMIRMAAGAEETECAECKIGG